jgi:hypothetical protein
MGEALPGGRHFRIEVGDARIEVNNGATIVHIFSDRTVRGDTGYICVMPMGIKPSDPPPQAKRPQSDEEDEEDL